MNEQTPNQQSHFRDIIVTETNFMKATSNENFSMRLASTHDGD